MDPASNSESRDPYQAAGEPQQMSSHDTQVYPQINASRNGTVDTRTPDEETQTAADQHRDVIEDMTVQDGCEGSKPQRLVIKLNHNTRGTPVPSSETRLPVPGPSKDHTYDSPSADMSNPADGDTLFKKETGDVERPSQPRDTSFTTSSAYDPKIKSENDGPVDRDRVASEQPLTGLAKEPGQVDVVKTEPTHKEHDVVEPAKQGQGQDQDEINVQLHQGEDMASVQDDDDSVSTISNIDVHPPTERGDAAAEPNSEDYQELDQEHASDPVEEGAGDELPSQAAPNHVRAGKVTQHSDESYVPDDADVDLDEGLSSESIQPPSFSGEESDEDGAGKGDETDGEDQEEEEADRRPRSSGPMSKNTLKVQKFRSQSHQGFTDPVHSTNQASLSLHQPPKASSQSTKQSRFSPHGYPSSRYVPEDSSGQSSQQSSNPNLEYEQRLMMLIAQKKRDLAAHKALVARQQGLQAPTGSGHAPQQMNKPWPMPMGPLSYQHAPNAYQHDSSDVPYMFGQYPGQMPMFSGGEMQSGEMPNMGQGPYPSQSYNMPVKPSLRSNSNSRLLGSYPVQGLSDMGEKVFDEHDCADEGEASDDGKPLKSGVKARPTVMSQDSVTGPKTSNQRPHNPEQDSDPDVEFISSTRRTTKPNVQNPTLKQRPLPQPTDTTTMPAPPSPEKIDWALPTYEVQPIPATKNEEVPSAKVSLPGMVREELLLSPDHSEQEVLLLLHVFLPAQRALPTPESEPAVALINFHTIAVMVLEAYAQYEIGDEFGLGRGHWHESHNDAANEAYERVRHATDADVDEIFFAVVDRWRAGRESGKAALRLVRGAQEFCDVALDVIYWVKEHGLLGPEAPGGPKGKGKGKAKEKEEEPTKKAPGKRPGTSMLPNEVLPRKKSKVDAGSASAPARKKRAKPSNSGVTVTVRKK
ncbi:hypothetical protein BDW02DRAFT_98654 [Decorospora gaudefroyi]|uniref:Uncharacterized protein n=1 Tax=Decorospora gaudefroyi TaxID=184978 RepID=A0A6A5JZT2_9PLEO|nr:hypothetical protein BDW02DRAFT_98654 [Decorospora gaudefroyi]